MTCIALRYVRQCTTSGHPHESRHIFGALKMNLSRGWARLCCCDFFLRTAAHADDDKPPASEKLVHWGLHRQLVDFFFGESISACSSLNESSSCVDSSRKRPILSPSCFIVPRIFCLNRTTTMSSMTSGDIFLYINYKYILNSFALHFGWT